MTAVRSGVSPSAAALTEVLSAARALANAVAAAPFPIRAVVGPEARACLQIPSNSGDDMGRMLRVEQVASLMSAEPELVEDPVGFYWQAEIQQGATLIQVWTRLSPITDEAQR